MEQKQDRTSFFASLPGLIILLIGAAAAIYWQAVIIGAFLLLILLVCLASRLWSRVVLNRIEVKIDALQSRCYVDGNLAPKVTVHNHFFLPVVWLDMILPAGLRPNLRSEDSDFKEQFVFPDSETPQTGIRRRLTWLLWHQEATWEEPISACRRGVVRMEGVWLRAGDGFGLSMRKRLYQLDAPVTFLIYPQLASIRVQPFLKITQQSTPGRSGQTEDVTLLKSSRPYMPGDSVKKINWRLLAHGLPMEINIYEKLTPGCAAFILHLETFRAVIDHADTGEGNWQEYVLLEQKLEGMISLIASVVLSLREQGVPSALIVPGYADREAVLRLSGGEDTDYSEVLDALASVDYLAQNTVFPDQEFWQMIPQLGNIYICSLSDRDVGFPELEEELGPGRVTHLVWERRETAEAGSDRESVNAGACLYAEDILIEKMDLGIYKKQRRGTAPVLVETGSGDKKEEPAETAAKGGAA